MTTDPRDPRLRFQLWVDGELADETWVDSSNPDSLDHADQIIARHQVIATRAQRDGRPWRVDCYDPADDTLTSFGTDTPKPAT